MTWRRLVILLISFTLLVAMVLKSRHSGDRSGVAAFSVSVEPVLRVELIGDLLKPGIYSVSDNMLAVDVIKMAKPLCGNIDYNGLILATGTDIAGKRIKVRCISGFAGVCELQDMSASSLLALGLPLDISRVSNADLELVPGIGPVMAQRIIEYRQLNGGKMTVNDLKNISGIGDSKFSRLKKQFN
jgi:competence protein ComEA